MLQTVPFNDTRIMLLKLFRSIVIGLIVAGLLLVAMPSLRQFNKLSAPQFDSTDETPATYNQAVRRAAPPWLTSITAGLTVLLITSWRSARSVPV